VVWDWSFIVGSFAASFIQGLTVGALVEGLPIVNGRYAGGDFGWFSGFAALCAWTVSWVRTSRCLLVGQESEGELRELAYGLLPYLAIGLLAFLVAVFAYALAENLQVMSRWLERQYLFVFPVIGALSASCSRSAFATATTISPFQWSS